MKINLLDPTPRLAPDPARLAELKSWVRELMRVDDSALVVINELACEDPDCPDVETSIVLSLAPKEYLTFSIPKPAAEVTRADLVQALTAPRAH